jgi:hypothetical protein
MKNLAVCRERKPDLNQGQEADSSGRDAAVFALLALNWELWREDGKRAEPEFQTNAYTKAWRRGMGPKRLVEASA